MQIKADKKTLPSRNAQIEKSIEETEVFDTRTEQQKREKKEPKTKQKTVVLSEESMDTLLALVEITELSERGILGTIVEQGLAIMAPKLEAAKQMDMVPKIDISKK